jgi:phage terminase large subunit-like protein
MCHYDGQKNSKSGGAKSPDRLDALVWALADLFVMPRRAPRVRTI